MNLPWCAHKHVHLRWLRQIRLAGIPINPGLLANRMAEIEPISCKLAIHLSANTQHNQGKKKTYRTETESNDNVSPLNEQAFSFPSQIQFAQAPLWNA